MIFLQVLNRSSASDDLFPPILAAIQQQITGDFQLVWEQAAKLSFAPQGTAPDPNQWWVAVHDSPQAAIADGFLDRTSRGYPLGFVTVPQDDKLAFLLSREVLSLLFEPDFVHLAVDNKGGIYARELCWAIDSTPYPIGADGIMVSNFVGPAWFGELAGVYDFRGTLSQPFSVFGTGYTSQLTQSGWGEFGANGVAMNPQAPANSRLERRRRYRANGYRQLSNPL